MSLITFWQIHKRSRHFRALYQSSKLTIYITHPSHPVNPIKSREMYTLCLNHSSAKKKQFASLLTEVNVFVHMVGGSMYIKILFYNFIIRKSGSKAEKLSTTFSILVAIFHFQKRPSKHLMLYVVNDCSGRHSLKAPVII